MSFNIFREDYKGDGMHAEVAKFMNRVGKLINNLRGVSNIAIYENNDGGMDFDVAPVLTGASSILNFSFRCRLGTREPVEPETEPVAEVRISAGFRKVVGADFESVAATEFDVASGGSIYCTWTHTTDTTLGAWSSPFWAYGTPTTENDAVRVIVLATVTSAGVITHRHIGDVVVHDIIDRTACA